MKPEQGKSGRGGIRTLVFLIILGLAGLTGWNLFQYFQTSDQEQAGTEPLPVRLAQVRQGQVDVVLDQSAEVMPRAAVLVVPKIKGQQILNILVERGDAVDAGQVLARLDTETYLAKRAEVLAARAAAEAKLEVLDKDLKRLKVLEASGSAPRQQLDHTLAEQRAARALRDQAQAQLGSLDIMLRDHIIRAPISGVIASRFVDAGSLSDDKQPMFRVCDESRVKVVTTVGERDFPLARLGLIARVRVDSYPGRDFSGKVEVISPVIDPATRSAEMEIYLDNEDRRLRSGMFARVHLVLGRRPALLVPRTAVQRMPGTGTRFVFLAVDGQAKLVNVETGAIRGDDLEITDGLTAGQTVVSRGAGRLSDGAPLAETRGVE